MNIAEALACVRADPDFQLICRFSAPNAYGTRDPDEPIVKVAVVDVETTGWSHDDDAIVEIGIVVCEVGKLTGRVYRVLDRFNAMEDPGVPIPEEATRIHGITDAMVAGHRIDDAEVERLLLDVSLVVAHNANFDRPFLEARLPRFQDIAWACSLEQVDWPGQGIQSAKLDYIAYKHGVFYEAHRALTDCEVLLHVLQASRSPDAPSPMLQLVEASRKNGYRLGALASPFAMKDVLKARGYRWDADAKIWSKLVLGDDLAREEALWMRDTVYEGRACRIEVEQLPATLRFSKRSGIVKVKPLPARVERPSQAA